MRIYHGSIEKVEKPEIRILRNRPWIMDMVSILQHPTTKRKIG